MMGFIALLILASACAAIYLMRLLTTRVAQIIGRYSSADPSFIAKQLHDTTLQSLTLANYVAEATVGENHPLREHLKNAHRQTHQTILRARAPEYGTDGLGEAAQHLADLLRTNYGLEVHWKWEIPPTLLIPRETADLCYHTIVECLLYAVETPEVTPVVSTNWERREIVLKVTNLATVGTAELERQVLAVNTHTDGVSVRFHRYATHRSALAVRIPLPPHSGQEDGIVCGTPTGGFSPNSTPPLAPLDPAQTRLPSYPLRRPSRSRFKDFASH